ncbi:HAMP domain-containing histidine kinase [Actinomycetaceae bacterium TAE3-ERU4]|nr:HAMP domain-containing histidine kinase [Actinomycetaceae bacterium TAE3-ERU4]
MPVSSSSSRFGRLGVFRSGEDKSSSENEKHLGRWRTWVRNFLPVRLVTNSLALRISVILTLLGVIVVAVMFGLVSVNLRNDVFQERVNQIDEDAAVRFSIAQQTFSDAAVTTVDQAQQVAGSVISEARNSSRGARGVGVVLLRPPLKNTTFAINEVMILHPFSPDVISNELRLAVEKSAGKAQFRQSVLLTDDKGQSYPGMVVGRLINVPLVHEQEMYIFYSLQVEQMTVSKMLRSILAGSVVLLIILGAFIWLLTYRALDPVKRTALAAERLAGGEFDVRVKVKGSDELAVLARSFNDMALSLKTTIDEYDELAKLQQRFVSDVSHELRTPLTTIKMAGEMIYDAREDFDPLSKRSAELLHGQIERFDRMLADLLEISRYDAQAAKPEYEFVDLVELTQQVISDNDPLAMRLEVPITLRAPQYPVRVEIDEKRIERVIRNLLVNAIEHAEGNPVNITIAENDEAVSLRVRDYGIGMNEEVAARVFDRFYRADPARARTTGGTGLGLAIATEDVHLHGGILEARGKPGFGSAFMMTLPRRFGDSFRSRALPLWDDGQIVTKPISMTQRPAALAAQFRKVDLKSTKVYEVPPGDFPLSESHVKNTKDGDFDVD